jgi:hypothetical protein
MASYAISMVSYNASEAIFNSIQKKKKKKKKTNKETAIATSSTN